jgi:hypothetical protein
MEKRNGTKWRVVRLMIWLVATAAASGWAGVHYGARAAAITPGLFLAILVPAVLLPFSKEEEQIVRRRS